MDFYSCIARRTRSGTDLYFRTISQGGSSARRASSRGSDSRTNVEDRASGCGSASNSEVRKSGRKRKKVSWYEPDDEDDCLFVGEGESREEQGDSVLFGSPLRSEKAKKGRFGSSVDGPGGLFGEKDMEDGDGDKVEVIVIDESDGRSSEDDFYGYEKSGDEIRSEPDSTAAAFGDENVINVDGEPFGMKKGAYENSGDEIRSDPYSAAAFGGENFTNVDKEPFEMREGGYENSGDDIRSEPCSAAVFGGENVINVDGEPFQTKKSAYENAGDEIRSEPYLAAAFGGQNSIIVDKEPFEMKEGAYENSEGEIRSEPDSAAAAFGGEDVINVDVEPFEMKEGANENSGDEIRSEPDLASAFGGEKVINVDAEPFEMKKSAYENAGDEIRYEPYLAAAFSSENFIIVDKEPFEMEGLFENSGGEIRSEPDSAEGAFGSENSINVDAVPFEKKEGAYENSGDDIRSEPDLATAFGGEKVINVDEEPFDMKEGVESIDLTKDDENDDFELVGRAGIGSRLWESDPAGLGSFGLESPIVSKWIFGESSCVTPAEKKSESLSDKGKNVLDKNGGNDQDVSGVSPMPSKVGESGFESFDLKSPVASKVEANGNSREEKEFESLGNDKGKKVLESDGGNGQDVSGVSPMPSKVGESPLEVSESESESSSEYDSDIFSSSSSSDDDDSQDEDYKVNEADYTTSEDGGLSFDDDDDEISDLVEENVADSKNEKEASVSEEDEKKSNQVEPPLKKRKFSSRENEAKVVIEEKDKGVAMDECVEEREKEVEVENQTSTVYKKNEETGDEGAAMGECMEEVEKEVEVENQTSTVYKKNEETGDEGAAMGECMEEVEKEVEAENEASPFCEKNEETGDDGATKEECSEKEVEAEIDASSICEQNVETRDDGFTDEVCGKKKEEEEIEADYEASPSFEKISETRNDGGTMEEHGKKDEGAKERYSEREEEKEVETSSIGENNGETRDDGATKEMYWERKVTKRVGVPFLSGRERKATRVGTPVFSGKERETKQRLVTRSSMKRVKIPGEKSNLSGTGRPAAASRENHKKAYGSTATAASRENLKKVYGSTTTAASRESLKKVYGSTKTAKEVEEGDKRNDEFIVGREEMAQKTLHSSTKFSEEESKKQEWQVEDEEEEEGKGDKIGPEGRDFSCKRKGAGGLKDTNIFRLLLDSITEKGEAITDHLVSSEEETTNEEDTTNRPKAADAQPLPLKFTFGVEEPEPLEKSESEKELDMLWAEMDFALKSLEIGSSVVEDEETNEVENGANLETLCKHDLILDEQIGIKCRFCSFVKLEIRYVLPPMAKFAYEGLGRKSSYNGENVSMFDGVQLQDLSSNPGDSFNQTKGTIWDIIPNIKSSMYPHQQEGFEFIWKNLAGTTEVEKLKSSDPDNVGGCIISHAPGTGKTRLTIVFLQTYLELFPKCRPVIIAPASLLLTWEEEFKKWNIGVPFHNLNSLEFSGKESAVIVKFLDRSRHQTQNKNDIRMVKLFSWCKDKSILGVSYSLYEKLAGEKFRKDEGTKKRSKVKRETETEELRKFLLDLPGLLVLDEGHTPRNQRSSIWKVLCELQTKKRIILSGTPFQNNFLELYNTLCLVRPGFADTIPSNLKKLCQRRLMREKRVKGEVLDSTGNSTGSLADEEIKQFKALMAPFVHVHKGSILQKNLPGLRDCVVVLNPPDLQKRLLEGIRGTSNTFEFEHKLALASVHPSLFQCMSLTKKEESILDQDWLERQRLNPNEGVKTRFLMEFVRLCDTVDEKILVFSQFIDPLCLIMDQLSSLLNWCEGREVLYMHGKLDQKTRQFMINKFNDPNSEAKVLLASTKACSEGINLVGASRVVLLDVVWNPSVERQAISRAYRIGQKKVVYTYHLITRGTTECDKYCKQAEKDRLSELVFSSEMVVSSTNKESDKQKSPAVVSDDKVLDEMIRHDKLKDMFEKIIYQPKESDLVESFGSMVLP